MHSLLTRQLQDVGISDADRCPEQAPWVSLIQRLDAAYSEADDERRALLKALNATAAEVEDLKRCLTGEVAQRVEAELAVESLRRKREHESKLDERRQIAHTVAALERFASSVAHDFNNALYIILTHCHLLEGELTTDEQRETLRELTRTTEAAAQLTKRIQGQASIQEARVVAFETVVRRVTAELSEQSPCDVEIVLEIDPRPQNVWMAPDELDEIVRQLINNAYEAIGPRGRLSIETWQETLAEPSTTDLDLAPGAYVALRVADSGPGMDPETRRHAFEPSYSTKGRHTERGWGLHTVYRFVTGAAGSIEIEPTSNPGTSIVVRLPAFRRASLGPTAPSVIPNAHTSGRGTDGAVDRTPPGEPRHEVWSKGQTA